MTNDNEEPPEDKAADRWRFAAMLDDPAFAAAWDGFRDQLDSYMDLVKRGVRPTGQAIRKAVKQVYRAAPDLRDDH